MSDTKPRVGEPVDIISFPSVEGGSLTIGGVRDRWTMLFVYRGKHCPRCKRFLNKLFVGAGKQCVNSFRLSLLVKS